MLVRQPFQAYAASYAGTTFHPANLLLADGTPRVPGRGELTAWQRADIERLVAKGIV
jgi:hypothetical protein